VRLESAISVLVQLDRCRYEELLTYTGMYQSIHKIFGLPSRCSFAASFCPVLGQTVGLLSTFAEILGLPLA